MMTYKLYILIALLLMMTGGAWAADESIGCGTGLADGITNNPSRGYTQCYLIESDVTGTLDSAVFSARDWNCGGGYGADTAYAAVYTMTASPDSSPEDVVAISQDSVEVSGTSYADYMVVFNGESITSGIAYHLCTTCRGSDDCIRLELCNDAPGYPNVHGANGVDAWPLEDPSALAYDNTAYAPDILIWLTTEDGESVSVGARRRKILLGQ